MIHFYNYEHSFPPTSIIIQNKNISARNKKWQDYFLVQFSHKPLLNQLNNLGKKT